MFRDHTKTNTSTISTTDADADADADPEADRPGTGPDGRREGWPQRLERARQERNHREMARLLLDGADTAMGDRDDHESLERAQWLLARTQRSLDACGVHPECLTLLCELMERQCRLSRCWARLGHPGQCHAAREVVRDLAFDVAGRAERLTDLGQRVSVILRVAEALDVMGDLGDAHALRVRAFHRLGAVGEHLAAVAGADAVACGPGRSCQ